MLAFRYRLVLHPVRRIHRLVDILCVSHRGRWDVSSLGVNACAADAGGRHLGGPHGNLNPPEPPAFRSSAGPRINPQGRSTLSANSRPIFTKTSRAIFVPFSQNCDGFGRMVLQQHGGSRTIRQRGGPADFTCANGPHQDT